MSAIEIAICSYFDKPYRLRVEGKVLGAWAAHKATNGTGFRVTFLRFGLAVPYYFDSMPGAMARAFDRSRIEG